MDRQERGGVSGGAELEAGGRLNPMIGLFGLAMSPRSASHWPNMLRWYWIRLPITGLNFRPMPSTLHAPWIPLSQS